MAGKTVLMAGAVVLGALGGGATVLGVSLRNESGKPGPSELVGDDFGRLRRDALDMFPRGSPVADAAEGLKALGFRCAPARHLLANINAPSVQCESAGRGFPHASRIQVTVLARNGMVSDIAVGDGFADLVADARTPEPRPEPPAEPAGHAAEGEGENEAAKPARH